MTDKQSADPCGSPTRPEGLDKNIWALSLVSLLTDAHSETILALLPNFMADVLHIPKSMIGVIEGAAEGMASLLQIASGWLSDHLGRRKSLAVVGYGLSTVVKLLLVLARGFGSVFAVRIGDRVGKGIRTAPRDALLADSVTPDKRGRAFGLHRAADTAGAVIGSGGAFLLFGLLGGSYSRVFLWAAIPGVLAVLVLAAAVRERSGAARQSRVDRGPLPPLHWTPALKLFLGANTLFSLGNFSYAFFLLRVGELRVPEHIIPLTYLLYNVVYALTAFPAGRLSDALGHRNLLWMSYLVYGVACLVMLLAGGPLWAWMGMAIYGVHSAMVNPAARAMASRLSEARKGTGLGLYHMLTGGAAFLASAMAGLLWDRIGSHAAFEVGLICALAGAAAMAAGATIFRHAEEA